MKNRFLLGAGVALAVALSWADAQAQLLSMPSGPGAWYIGGEGGWSMLDDATSRIGGFRARQRFDDGFNVGARAGYELGPWRFEEEFSYRQNGVTNFGGVATRGDRNTYAIMTNAIYDFTFGSWPGVSPHIGGGIGAVIVRDSFGTRGPGFAITHSSDTEFGYQGIAGVRYNINPSLAFDLDYRYLGVVDPTFRTAIGGVRYTSEHSSHSILASLTVKFGAPPVPVIAPPPPPPMAAPAPPKVFLVFFDWDRDTITPEGMQIIQQAAATFRACGSVRLQVTGYTDASGSVGYNQRLSERRANNVAGALARLGVPRQAMSVSGRGKNDQRVPTADGVREPQNRRVEIVFP